MAMKVQRRGAVGWTGGLRDGRGSISTASGALQDYPYGFRSRFEGVAGSNPEELLAAAHAACFTMSLTLALERAGFTATRLDCEGIVTLEGDDSGYRIPLVQLRLVADVPGIDQAQLRAIADAAEKGCPVSRLFNAEIELDAKLA